MNFALHSIRHDERAILLGLTARDVARIANVRDRRNVELRSVLAFSALYRLRCPRGFSGEQASFVLAAINGPDFLSVRGLMACAPTTIIAHGSGSALQKLCNELRHRSETYSSRVFTFSGGNVFVGEA